MQDGVKVGPAREASAVPAESEQTSRFEVKARRIGLVHSVPSSRGERENSTCHEFSTGINADGNKA